MLQIYNILLTLFNIVVTDSSISERAYFRFYTFYNFYKTLFR